MSQPLNPLKKAIRATLVADTALTTMLGGARVHDEVPRNMAPPYVAFGEATIRDLSTTSGRAHETMLTLQVLSVDGGSRAASVIAARIEALLHDAVLTLDAHRLVNLTLNQSDTRRERNNEATRVTLRFRAYTEVL
jgi:Protein of unknown function (DUF3168)